MSRWTIKELDTMDDLTFAMCVLSERKEKLHQGAPLAQKLASARKTLEQLRDATRQWPNVSVMESVYRKMQHDYLIEDIKAHLTDESYSTTCSTPDFLSNLGLSPDDVLSDTEMISRITELFHKHDGENDYWGILHLAVIQGVTEVIESRK